jgi:hypothetical protein
MKRKKASTNRPVRFTEGAKRKLRSSIDSFEKRTVHEAEDHMLRENRTEITESDIQKAERIVRLTPTSGRKWVMRICTILVLALLLSHFVVFSELPSMPFTLLFRLYLPTIVMLVWICLLMYFYKEDLL